MVRYDPYTDSFIDNPTKETTATISLDAFPKATIQRVVEVSDESVEKIADAVVRKLKDRKTEPQKMCDAYCNEDCTECAKEWQDWKDQMWTEAEIACKTEPQTDCSWK